MPPDQTSRFLDRSTKPHIATLVLMAGLSAMSMNVFLPSLPSMSVHFETSYSVMQLSVSLYLAMNAVLQLVIGPVSDWLGRRPVVIASTVLFLLATVGTIYAPNAEVFLLFRMAQAVIVSGLVLSRAIVRDMYGMNEAASMIGYVTMGMALVPMVAPMLGGILDQSFGWQANFWLLFVCGVVVLVITWLDLKETAQARAATISDQVKSYPELLRSQRFWGYAAAAAFASGAFFAYLGGAPFVATEVFGLSPAVMGAYFGFPALGYAAGNFISGRFSARMGVNRMILVGSSLTLFGLTLLLALYGAGLSLALPFFALFTFVGLGNGMVIPNATAGLLSVRPHLAGTASGLGGALMIGGGAALSAIAGALLTPGSGPTPLLVLMVATSTASVLAIIFVIHRARVVNAS